MKKIIFYLNDLGRGGAQRVVSNLANRMVADEYEVTIAMSWKAEPEYEVSELVHKVYLGYANDSDKGRLTILKSRVNGLRKLLKTQKPDCILVFGRSAIYRAIMAKRSLTVPMIISIRTDPNSEYTGLKNKLFKGLLERVPSGCVFQTRQAMEFFSKKLQNKSTIIQNQLSEEYLNVHRNEKRDPLIVTFGRIVKLKNHQMILDAFYKMHQKYPEYRLEIYGDYEDRALVEELKQNISNHHMEEFAAIMGNTTQVKEILHRASMFILSSDYEGMPNALLEAMAMGVASIATDCPCGGPAEVIVNRKNGILIPVRDTIALEHEMDYLLSQPDVQQKIGMEAMKIIEKVHPNIVYHEWKKYIESKMS